MTIAETIPDVAGLDPAKKWQLANELWEEVEKSNDAFPVREDHVKILEERWSDYKENPGDTTSWDEIKRRLGKD